MLKKEDLQINEKREFDVDDDSGNISEQELETGNKIKARVHRGFFGIRFIGKNVELIK